MKKTVMKSKATKVKISGETFLLINKLSAILVQSSVTLSSAQKAIIGKEFQRAYKIMSQGNSMRKTTDKLTTAKSAE